MVYSTPDPDAKLWGAEVRYGHKHTAKSMMTTLRSVVDVTRTEAMKFIYSQPHKLGRRVRRSNLLHEGVLHQIIEP